ncbi:hypothetical protein ABFT80_17690 [Mesorhizobium sp. SB112]|uniref:hypothetical protein n=1 Tax=Mesorhizobium sp. SB112 TaxID=3151853 RepID=UPI0032637366
MNSSLTLIFCGIVLWFLVSGMMRPDRVYQFPFLAGVITFAFILPQLPGVSTDPFMPDGAYVKTMIMGILCLLMLRLGWSEKAKPFEFLNVTLDERKLLMVAGFFSIIGAYFYLQLSRLPGELTVGVQQSGVSVMYLFFARLLTYGLVISSLCFARRRSLPALAIILFDLIFYFDRIIITGKRAEAIELILILVLPYWFMHRWAVPRIAVIAGLVVGTVAMVSMGDYREITRAHPQENWNAIADIDFEGNFKRTLENGGEEMRNAVLRINQTDRTLKFDYGKFHWNRIVFNYVPAQLVGAELKQSLLFTLPTVGRGYTPSTGSTETGMADAFQSFWYFGAFKFLLLSWLMVRIWNAAMAGMAAGQIIYILSIVPAMHAISHQTDWVVTIWVHIALFLAPALVYAMASRQQVASVNMMRLQPA